MIREMRLEDVPYLAELYRQFWGDLSCVDKMRKQFVGMQEKGNYILLSAVEDEKLVGSVMGVVCDELYGNCQPFCVLENMIVDNKVRKKGVGRSLFRELERQAKEKKCTQIILVTEKERLDACAFYEACGFQQNNAGYKKKL